MKVSFYNGWVLCFLTHFNALWFLCGTLLDTEYQQLIEGQIVFLFNYAVDCFLV